MRRLPQAGEEGRRQADWTAAVVEETLAHGGVAVAAAALHS
jgi:hypothetical protein